MAIRSYNLTLGAAAARVSDAYGGALTAAKDIPYRQILLSSSGADAFVGDSDVSTTVYGVKLDSTDLQPVYLGGFDEGPLKLSDLYAGGAGATLHILAIPY